MYLPEQEEYENYSLYEDIKDRIKDLLSLYYFFK